MAGYSRYDAGSEAGEQARLKRVRDGRIGGVCGGIATYLKTDPDMVRMIAVLLTVLTVGALSVVYLVLWLVLPIEQEHAGEVRMEPDAISSEVYGAVAGVPSRQAQPGLGAVVYLAMAIGIAVLVAVMSIVLSGIATRFEPVQFWPLAIIAVGIARMVIPDAGGHHVVPVAVGAMLFFVGLVALLVSLGLAQLRVEAWIAQGMPLLLATAGLLLLGQGLDSAACSMAAAAVFALFCLVGVVFYLDPGTVSQVIALLPDGREVAIWVVL